MRTLIRHFDALLSRAYGVFHFSDDRDCVLRLQVARTRRPLCFAGQEVRIGEPVLVLHLWNEQIPPLSPAGPDLAWAAQIRRLFIHSLRAVAVQMSCDPRLAGVRAVGGATTLLSFGDHPGGRRFLERLGFTILPYHSPLGRFGEFWENLYAWSIMWTFNVVSLRYRQVLHLRRAELWMAADEFLSRYGPGETTNVQSQPPLPEDNPRHQANRPGPCGGGSDRQRALTMQDMHLSSKRGKGVFRVHQCGSAGA